MRSEPQSNRSNVVQSSRMLRTRMVEFKEPGWIERTPTRSGEIDGVKVVSRHSKTSIAIGEISLQSKNGRRSKPAMAPEVPDRSVSPRTGASPQLRLSRSVATLRHKVRVMGTTWDPTEPLPPPSRGEIDGDRGFFKNLVGKKAKFGGRRGSEPIFDEYSTLSKPSPVTRPLLSKPKPRYEHFERYHISTRSDASASSDVDVDSDSESDSGASTQLVSPPKNQSSAFETQWRTVNFNPDRSIDRTMDIYSEEGPAGGVISEEWTQFQESYAEGRYNISLPPHPPTDQIPGGFLAAPTIDDEQNRIKAVIQCSGPFSERAREKCLFFMERAQQSFKTDWAYISFIDEENENFKLELPAKNVGPVARKQSLGGHVLLTQNEPMVILDTLKDWRFAQNSFIVDTCQTRFYAGAPIVNNDGYVVGVFAVASSEPRPAFAAPQRRRLMDFARTTMLEIEIIISEVQSEKRRSCQVPSISLPENLKEIPRPFPDATNDFAGNRDSFLSGNSRLSTDLYKFGGRRASETSAYHSMTSTLTPNSPMLPPSAHGLRRPSSVVSFAAFQKDSTPLPAPVPLPVPALSAQAPRTPSRPPQNRLSIMEISQPPPSVAVVPRKASTPSPLIQNPAPARMTATQPAPTNLVETTYALSVMAYSMDFDLVYLLRVRPKSPFLTEEELLDDNILTKVLASFGMPTPELSFESNMHLKALRAQNGFLFNNENDPEEDPIEYQTGVILPLVQDRDKRMATGNAAHDWSVCRSGIVLGAYSLKPRVVDEEMLARMKEFATGMRDVLLKVDGYLDGGMLG